MKSIYVKVYKLMQIKMRKSMHAMDENVKNHNAWMQAKKAFNHQYRIASFAVSKM